MLCRVMRPRRMRCRPMAWGHRACRIPAALLTLPQRLPHRPANRASPCLALATQAACTLRSQVCPLSAVLKGLCTDLCTRALSYSRLIMHRLEYCAPSCRQPCKMRLLTHNDAASLDSLLGMQMYCSSRLIAARVVQLLKCNL